MKNTIETKSSEYSLFATEILEEVINHVQLINKREDFIYLQYLSNFLLDIQPIMQAMKKNEFKEVITYCDYLEQKNRFVSGVGLRVPGLFEDSQAFCIILDKFRERAQQQLK